MNEFQQQNEFFNDLEKYCLFVKDIEPENDYFLKFTCHSQTFYSPLLKKEEKSINIDYHIFHFKSLDPDKFLKEPLTIDILQKDKKKIGTLVTKIRDLEVGKEEKFQESLENTKGLLEYQTIIKMHTYSSTKTGTEDPSETKVSLTSLFKKVKSHSIGEAPPKSPNLDGKSNTDTTQQEDGFFNKLRKRLSLKNESGEPTPILFKTPQHSPGASPPRSPEVTEDGQGEKKVIRKKRKSLLDFFKDIGKENVTVENKDSPTEIVNVYVQPEKVYKTYEKEIDEVVKRDGGKCPKLFQFLIDYLTKNKVEEEKGIFRISPAMDELDEFITNLDANDSVDTTKYKDIHLYSCALKQYLKTTPTSLIPVDLYEPFLASTKIEDTDELIGKLKELLSQIPKEKKDTLGVLLEFLVKISANYKENMMNTQNIAVVFGVNALRGDPKGQQDPMRILKDSQKITSVFESFLIYYDKIKDVFI